MNIINILAVGDPAVYGYTKKDLKIIENYELKNNVKINFDIIEWENYYDTLMNSFKEYKYDIVMVAGHLWLSDFVSKGYLKAINKDDLDSEYDFDDFIQNIKEELHYNKQLYLLPSFCDGHMLAYRDNVTLPNKEILSYNDIINLSKNYNLVCKAHPSEVFLDFLPYLRTEGIDAFDKEGNLLFLNDLGLKALNKYKEVINQAHKDTLSFGNAEVLEAIQNKTVDFAVSWGGQIGQILNDNCIDKESLNFIGLQESWNVTWSFGIVAISPNYHQALQFIKYLSNKENDKIIGDYCGNPTRLSTYLNDTNHKWYPNLLKMLQNSKPLPNLVNTGELIALITEELVKFLNSSQSAEDTLRNLNK